MRFSRSAKIIIVLSIFLWGNLRVSDAFRVNNLEFKDQYSRGPYELTLRGAGLKKFLSIQVVAVGLYLNKSVKSQDALSDVPKSIEVVYLQNIPSLELQRATTKGIRHNISPKEFQALQARIDQMNSYYPEVLKMDRILVTYIPGKGTEVSVNGRIRGVIAGADFAKAFFSIWVGNYPVDPRIKQLLLGNGKQSADET